jgi:hypothetical protein
MRDDDLDKHKSKTMLRGIQTFNHLTHIKALHPVDLWAQVAVFHAKNINEILIKGKQKFGAILI